MHASRARNISRWCFATVVLVAAAACSKREPAAPAATADAAKPAEASPAQVRAACEMVTAAEMSKLVGTNVVAEGENGGGTTTCRYQQADGSMLPRIEITVDWGSGAAAMAGMSLAGRLEPGMADPLAGLGDQASAIGPGFMIRLGDDFLNLMVMGVEDSVAVARSIVDVIRPRMGPSAQAKSDERIPGDRADDEAAGAATAAAAEMVSGLLNASADAANEAAAALSDTSEGGNSAASVPRPGAATIADEPALSPATGPRIAVPLVAGLTLVGAEHEAGRGDYEPIVTISSVTPDAVSTVFSANLPEGSRVVVSRDVRSEDLRSARALFSWYEAGDPRVFAGMTAFSVSAAVYNDLKTTGRARLDRMSSSSDPLIAFAEALGGAGDAAPTRHPGTLQRIEPHAVAFPVLLNDEPVHLHAIHARGVFDDATLDFHFLDDPNNPLLLRIAGASVGRIVRISFPLPAAALEKKLKDESRVALHGIYFDLGKATLRPESEPVLQQIAAALAHNPGWKLSVEGHTDNVGGDALNLDLSRRRAEAVKQALVERHRAPAANLTTAGFGATRPTASNDTLSGRAQNRRVELVRQ